MRFEQFHVQPLCTPTRVQLMTGKYNSRNYIAFGSLKPGEQTFAHYLKRAGYATCVVGKRQLDGGGTPVVAVHRMTERLGHEVGQRYGAGKLDAPRDDPAEFGGHDTIGRR